MLALRHRRKSMTDIIQVNLWGNVDLSTWIGLLCADYWGVNIDAFAFNSIALRIITLCGWNPTVVTEMIDLCIRTLAPAASISGMDKQLHPTEYCGMQVSIPAWNTCFWLQSPHIYEPFHHQTWYWTNSPETFGSRLETDQRHFMIEFRHWSRQYGSNWICSFYSEMVLPLLERRILQETRSVQGSSAWSTVIQKCHTCFFPDGKFGCDTVVNCNVNFGILR